MSRIEEIRAKLKEWCNKGAPQPTMLGVVKSVNEKEQTCVVEDDGLEYPKVRLSPVLTGSDGLTTIPVVGKYALCARIEGDDEWYMVSAEAVAKYILKIGEISLVVDDGSICFNDGKNGGLLKIDALIGKLNNIEDSLSQLKKVFATWIPVPTDGGAALKASVASWSASPIKKTIKADLENKKVTH